MDRVAAPDDWHTRSALVHRGVPELIRQREPSGGGRAQIAAGSRVAAIEHAAQMKLAHVFRCHRANVGLNQLADALLERECSENGFNARLKRFVTRSRAQLRPRGWA